MSESDVGLIRLIVLATLPSYLAVDGQKILCGHSCIPKYRTRESRTDMQQALEWPREVSVSLVVYRLAQSTIAVVACSAS